MSPTILREVFRNLYGIPCWSVRQGHGSFLTFEFGSPRQETGDVIERRPDDPTSYARRHVGMHGDWHLWIYCCGWRIAQDGNVLANSESTRESITQACAVLEGQTLTEITFRPERGASRFKFDRGGKINTGPYDDELNVQWRLFCPDRRVLSYQSDGAFSYFEQGSNEGEQFSQLAEEGSRFKSPGR
jgi:hypothetical protein